MRVRRTTAFLPLSLAAFCRSAVALEGQVTEEPAPRRESAVYGVAGFGTPVGGLGLEVVRRCGEKFELSFGVGEGMAAALAQPKGTFGHAVQWSVMPRVRFGNESDAFTFGVGLSGGEYAYETGFCLGCSDGETRPSATYRTFYTLWTNVEIGGQHLSASGFAFRYFLGLAHGYEVEAGRSLAFPIPYLGVGNLGYAF